MADDLQKNNTARDMDTKHPFLSDLVTGDVTVDRPNGVGTAKQTGKNPGQDVDQGNRSGCPKDSDYVWQGNRSGE